MQRLSNSTKHSLWILGLWLVIFGASCFTPPLLDDADATHAQAAQAMLHTHDFVTLHVNGIRYLEKPPLPYWIAAASMAIFGENAFAIHLPLALTALGLAVLGYVWSRRAFGDQAAFLTAVFTLSSVGIFLFTRIFIPDALLALLLATALYHFLRAIDRSNAAAGLHAYAVWTVLALAVLTKGLVSLVFFAGTVVVFLLLTRGLRMLGRLRPFTGFMLFLAIAAPWHIFAGLRNTGGADGHGFFWFYFVNEHLLRFLGRRVPRDYNKMPALAYWLLHVVWLFPWSFFVPAVLVTGRKADDKAGDRSSFARQTVVLLTTFAGFVLVFFAVSTNQEYYTLPAYLPLLILLAAFFPRATPRGVRLTLLGLTAMSLCVTAALGFGLYTSRALPFNPDIGSLLAHRAVGNYTLSMSHFFDLTGASFAALRLPAALAAIAFACGPAAALVLHRRGHLEGAILTVAATMATFFVAAHLALERFAPMLSSEAFVPTIQRIQNSDPETQIALYGDQAFGSSIPFYLRQHVGLVDGRSTSMLFGSTFADAPAIFLSHQQLSAEWANGPRHLLFVPLEQREAVEHVLGPRAILVQELSGKALFTDRPLNSH